MNEEIQTNSPFSDMGLDIEVGTSLFNALNIGAAEFASPIQMSKVREIAEYLSDAPDPHFLIGTLVRSNKSPQVSNLDHFAAFVKLSKEKQELMKQVEEREKALLFYE